MKRENPLTGGGTLLLILGAAAFFLPMLGRELIILAWLGDMEQPVGLSAMIVGGVLFAIGKLRDLRNASPVPSPTDAAVTPNQLRSATPAEPPQSTDSPRN